jgi:hypothetical protein
VQFIYHGDCMEFVMRGHMQGDLSGVSLECGYMQVICLFVLILDLCYCACMMRVCQCLHKNLPLVLVFIHLLCTTESL